MTELKDFGDLEEASFGDEEEEGLWEALQKRFYIYSHLVKIVVLIFITLAVLVVFSLAIGMVTKLMPLGGHRSEVDRDRAYEAAATRHFEGVTRLTFLSDIINVPAGGHNDSYQILEGVNRPQKSDFPGFEFSDILIHSYSFRILNQYGEVVPLETVYNHHLFLMEADMDNHISRVIGAIGAEGGARKVAFPTPYAIRLNSTRSLILGFHLLNPWGMASGANYPIRVEYSFVASPLTANNEQKVTEVVWQLMQKQGDVIEFNVTGNGGKGSTMEHTQEFEWKCSKENAKIVFAWGHIHIGAQSSALYALHNGKQDTVAISKPTYSSAGYITSLGRVYPDYAVPKGATFKILSVYDNSMNFGQVMSLFQVYSTCNVFQFYDDDNNHHDGDNDDVKRTEGLVSKTKKVLQL